MPHKPLKVYIGGRKKEEEEEERKKKTLFLGRAISFNLCDGFVAGAAFW